MSESEPRWVPNLFSTPYLMTSWASTSTLLVSLQQGLCYTCIWYICCFYVLHVLNLKLQFQHMKN